jgi:hypothetical protein
LELSLSPTLVKGVMLMYHTMTALPDSE